MSWLVSLVLAGMMFTSEINLPIQTSGSNMPTNSTQVVRLDETERFEQTYPLNPNGRVSVENINGSITVEAWDRNEVKVLAIKTADKKEDLADIDIKINARPDYLRIEADFDRMHNNGSWGKVYKKLEVEFRLMVPRTAILNEIESVNGSITVSNMANVTRISAVNGNVSATNLRGAATLETVNGTVDADFSALQAGTQISLSTVNGRANLVLPSDANATVRAETTSGSITNEFGLPVRKGAYVGRDLYGRIGNGDVRIKLESVNGQLSLRRKQDGKTLSPATNLLRTNGRSADDMENEDAPDSEATVGATSSSKARSKAKTDTRTKVYPGYPGYPAIVIPPMPPINVDVAKEMENAQKEIAKAQREMAKVDAAELNRTINESIRKSMETQRVALSRMNESLWFTGSPSVERKSDSFTVKGTPKVTIDAQNCSVVVKGWDKQEVQYSMTRVSRISGQAPVDAQVSHTDSDVNIRIGDSGATGQGSVRVSGATRTRIEVYVPKKSNLRIITNREIRLENVSGEIDLQGGQESINVRDVDGKLAIETVDGRVRVIGFKGEFDGKTADGSMNLEGDFRKFNAETGAGTIVLSLPENTNAVFEADAEIESEGLNLIRKNEDDNSWRLGNGNGTLYRMIAGGGKIFVRNAKAINTTW